MGQVGASFSYSFATRAQPVAADFNKRWADIDRRLTNVEQPQDTLDQEIAKVRDDAITRYNNDILPIYQSVVATVQLGALFTARATGTLTVGLGQQTFIVNASDRVRFAAGGYIAAVSADGNFSMSGNVVSYDSASGTLILNAQTAVGLFNTASSWNLAVCPPPVSVTPIDAGLYDGTDTVAPRPPVLFRRSNVAGKVPSVSDFNGNTFCVNTADGRLYYLNASGVVSVSRLTATAPTMPLGDTSEAIATTAFTQNALNALINGSPAALNTLKELADALGDDANFSTTVTTALSNRLRIDATQALTVTQQLLGQQNLGILKRVAVSDQAYTSTTGDRLIAVTKLTAARTITLPSASNFPTGAVLTVVDESGSCSATNTITIAPAGTDKINGSSTSSVIFVPYGFLAFESTGTAWAVVDAAVPSASQIIAGLTYTPAKQATGFVINGSNANGGSQAVSALPAQQNQASYLCYGDFVCQGTTIEATGGVTVYNNAGNYIGLQTYLGLLDVASGAFVGYGPYAYMQLPASGTGQWHTIACRGAFNVTSGRTYRLHLFMYNDNGANSCNLNWVQPSITGVCA